MNLQPEFHFTQECLQDFVDCPRRFQLRYLLRLAYPAAESEPLLEQERLMRQGALFHRLVQQHLSGIPAEKLGRIAAAHDAAAEDDQDSGRSLERWWENYLHSAYPAIKEGERFVERSLSAPFGGCRLQAKYDLIVLSPSGEALIMDWKTARRPPQKERLAKRLQTIVYPYLLVRAGGELCGGRGFAPEAVRMSYWFADYPDTPITFDYSAEQFAADEASMTGLVEEIKSYPGGAFPMTLRTETCRYCVFRSYCERGRQAGLFSMAEEEEEPEDMLDIDFDQAAEIAFEL